MNSLNASSEIEVFSKAVRFVQWAEKNYPNIRFEGYPGDIIVHCINEKQAPFN